MTGTSDIQGQVERDGAVQPGKERALEDLINVDKYLMGGDKEDRARGFSVVSSQRTRWNRHELK